MLKRIVSSIRIIEIFLLIIGYILGFMIGKYLGFTMSWSRIINGMMELISLTLGFKFLGNYFYRKFSNLPFTRNQSKDLNRENKEIREIENLYLLLSVAFFAIAFIPLLTILRTHSFNQLNLTVLSLGIFFLGAVEIFRELISRWGMMEIFKSFLYANLIPALAFTLQVGTIHRFVFLLTFPLFFLYFAQFIILYLPTVQEISDESSSHLISIYGTFAVLRIHNVSILIGFLFFLLGTFFQVPWRIIWPPLIMIPVGLVQIWHTNQILSGKKPNFRVLELTAISIAFFCTYFLILSLWLN